VNSDLSKTFRATLEATATLPRWVVVRVPVDLKKMWPQWKSRRVLGQINGFAFKTALIPGAQGQGFVLIVNKKMQSGARVKAGERALITLKPDLGEIKIDLPPEFAKILRTDRALKKYFDAISPSMRKGFSQFIADAKTAETRQKCAEAVAESLMLAMEGETEAPPILRVQFQRQPQAQRGWQLMTATQRKHHLLGIFFSQTVAGRERRAAKVVESCLAVARRRPQP
jgi:uncharacterized protein YdeI (YjbR/CyaY-like superfamily)